MRFSEATAMTISVVCRPSVREQRVTDDALVAADIRLHQGTPIVTRYPLPAHAASLGDQLQMPVARRRRGLCRSAWHRARTGRHNDRHIRMTLAVLTVDVVPIVRSIAGKRRNRFAICPSKGSTCEPSSTSLLVSSAAMICPVSASTPIWSFLQDRHVLVACFSTSHLPGPHSLSPVLSTSRCTGSPLGRGRDTAPPAQDRMVWRSEIKTKQPKNGCDQPFGLA
jgi:hypothetical protein